MNIENYLKEFVDTFLGEDFKWRKSQKEAIIEIINAYQNNFKTVILDCPTGGGKSIIGMAVAWILNKENKKGYILASDLSLQEQYENDFNRFNINWGSIKGINNYLCIDNDEKNSLGTCRIRNKKARSMPCYNECPYYLARDKASISPTSLLNYSYWLIMMNYVHPSMLDESPFQPRDFTIADEAHKIVDIIQNHYSPRFDSKTIEKLEKLTRFFALYKLHDHIKDFHDIKIDIDNLYKTENLDKLHEILIKIKNNLQDNYRRTWEKFKDKVQEDYPHNDPPKEWKEALRLCDWIKDLHCKVDDYNDIINKTSTKNIVKNPTGDNELTFNCLEESYMMHKYFHASTGFTVLMSATFADPSKYLKSIALNNAKYIKTESNFNFEKSPIYFYSKRRMTYNKMEENLPWLYKKIDEILEKHKNENGLIHTASYHLSMKIYENISKTNRKRILIYNGSEEKKEVLQILKINKNKILCGPSLTEGLNMKDDWCRFAIFSKVPYLSLGDKFVSTKLKINPEWYREKAILSLLQGTGRSVRSETDWAITYILDGALSDLIHNSRKSFPKEFLQRIKIVE